MVDLTLVPNILNWAETSSLSMGNWISMAELKKTYSKLNIEKPIILKKQLPIEEVNEKLKESTELYFIGFDKLQAPKCSISYKFLK